MNENNRYKIFYRELDENGNEIGETKVYRRDYAYYSKALSVAIEQYGPKNKLGGVSWRIALRDPWVNYTQMVTCERCGKQHEVEETLYGHAIAATAHMYIPSKGRMNKGKYIKNLCPECIEEFEKFFDSKPE